MRQLDKRPALRLVGEERIAQEMVLGIGGVKALRALKIRWMFITSMKAMLSSPVFELVREKMERGRTFDQAIAASGKK